MSETVRLAETGDVAALGPMLARAFADDPVAIWGARDPRRRARMLEVFHGTRARHLIPHEEVWMTAGGESAALWAPPGRWKTSAREDLELTRAMASPALWRRAPLVGWGLLAVERRHPPQPPHLYLATLGTDPAAQGRGLASAVLEPGLIRCDREGLGAYLESSKEANIAFYARFGFRVTEVLKLPRGPRMWRMWREPR